MVTKKQLLNNVLMQTLVSVKYDSLFAVLEQKGAGFMPEAGSEKAKGKLDDKGGIFIPGAVLSDEDFKEAEIETITSYNGNTETEFRQIIRQSLSMDNGLLIFPDGYANGVILDITGFCNYAKKILGHMDSSKTTRKKISKKEIAMRYSSLFEIRESTIQQAEEKPKTMQELMKELGTKTTLSAAIAVCLSNRGNYFTEIEQDLEISPILTSSRKVLAPDFIYTYHTTKLRANYVGAIKILGYGNIGDFATFTIENITHEKLENHKILNSPKQIKRFSFAKFDEKDIIGVLRLYSSAKTSGLPRKVREMLIDPKNDLNLNLAKLAAAAFERYKKLNKSKLEYPVI